MKYIRILLLSICAICLGEGISARNLNDVDSISYVANRLLDYDVYINSYRLSDAELDWIENEHPNWIPDFFPSILDQYDCTLYSKFALATSLYKNGEPQYLRCLWKKFGYLFEIEGKRSEDDVIGQIWKLLDWLKINPHKLESCNKCKER